MKTMTEKFVQIGELAKTLGITTRTIRYYEEIGLMGPSERLGGGTRTYSRDDILRLKFILKLKELGISLKEMQELAENFDINQQSFGTITPKLLTVSRVLMLPVRKLNVRVVTLARKTTKQLLIKTVKVAIRLDLMAKKVRPSVRVAMLRSKLLKV